jgi:hypothetical protein
MEYDQLITAARDALGTGEKEDYVIAPIRHADQLAGKAPALERMLRRSELGTIAQRYEEKDTEAEQAQLVFKRTTNRANWAVFLTACFSAFLLMTALLAALSTGMVEKWLQILSGSGGILSGAFGSMWLFKVREGHLLERWMTARAAAETRRIQYFDLATAVQDDGENSSIPLPLLQFEYFRRYQLEAERAFYRRRSEDHQQAADSMLTLSAIAVALASFATGMGGLLGVALSPQWVSIAGFGVVATALSAFASAKEAVSQDRRNMERYRRTLEALESLSGRLDTVRMAAALGEREPLEQFVAAVHEQLSLEHRQWLETSESTTASLAKLEDALARSQAKLPKADVAEADPAQITPGRQS